MLVWKSQWLSGKSTASQDGRLPVRDRPGHWSVEEGVGGTGEESGDAPETGGTGGTGGTRGRWRSSRICQDREENKQGLCFKSKYLLLNNTIFLFFVLLLPSFTFFFSFSGTRSSVRRLLSCFGHTVLQRPGRDSNRSLSHGRLWPYHWATGTFTLTLLFFALLSFLIPSGV